MASATGTSARIPLSSPPGKKTFYVENWQLSTIRFLSSDGYRIFASGQPSRFKPDDQGGLNNRRWYMDPWRNIPEYGQSKPIDYTDDAVYSISFNQDLLTKKRSIQVRPRGYRQRFIFHVTPFLPSSNRLCSTHTSPIGFQLDFLRRPGYDEGVVTSLSTGTPAKASPPVEAIPSLLYPRNARRQTKNETRGFVLVCSARITISYGMIRVMKQAPAPASGQTGEGPQPDLTRFVRKVLSVPPRGDSCNAKHSIGAVLWKTEPPRP